MKEYISDIAFTDTVKEIQKQKGSRNAYAHMEQDSGWQDTVTKQLKDFIAERDSFYMATVNAEGQPYIQHRGGPKGFLKVIDDRTRLMIAHWVLLISQETDNTFHMAIYKKIIKYVCSSWIIRIEHASNSGVRLKSMKRMMR